MTPQDKTQAPEREHKTFESVGLRIPQVYLPGQGMDLTRWAVVACDQYTSQPEYWNQVEALVGDAPSTLNLTLPEIYLGKPREAEWVQRAQNKMHEYLDQGVLEMHEGLVYVERSVGGKTRKGLIVALDLERYDFRPGSSSLIRATEGTIVERIPPRMKIRSGAALELPHILVLIDDPQFTVIEPLAAEKQAGKLQKLYDFDLMMDSGHLSGYLVNDADLQDRVIKALEGLADPQVFNEKYGLEGDKPVLLYAMGDGNHSLATAKSVWEKLKPEVGLDHPARYALVELENVHDAGLEFEPIHRVLFGLREELLLLLQRFYGTNFNYKPCEDCVEMMDLVEQSCGDCQMIGVTFGHQYGVITIPNPTSNLAVGTLQPFLDDVVKQGKAECIDYVHGQCVICQLTATGENIGFYLPNMAKHDLFKTVILDGALPRKTFSMGEAHEKRFYMECRCII